MRRIINANYKWRRASEIRAGGSRPRVPEGTIHGGSGRRVVIGVPIVPFTCIPVMPALILNSLSILTPSATRALRNWNKVFPQRILTLVSWRRPHDNT